MDIWLSSDLQPDYTRSIEDCSFAEPGRDLPKDDIRTVASIPSRKTKNKSYYKLNNKRSSIKAHTYK